METTWCECHNWALSSYPGRRNRCALAQQGECRPVVKAGVVFRWDYDRQLWMDVATGEPRS